MELKEWLDFWSMSSLKVNVHFLEMGWRPNDADKDAGWGMYITLIARVATQNLLPQHGDEPAALTSINKLFDFTREIIKSKARHRESFTKLAIILLNQKIRPFAAKWHRIGVQKGFDDAAICGQFRTELQAALRT